MPEGASWSTTKRSMSEPGPAWPRPPACAGARTGGGVREIHDLSDF
ncbi:MAG: hypothetical protein ACYDHX_08525 [Methanothrix sp.]